MGAWALVRVATLLAQVLIPDALDDEWAEYEERP
jgi:hypothetical protein